MSTICSKSVFFRLFESLRYHLRVRIRIAAAPEGSTAASAAVPVAAVLMAAAAAVAASRKGEETG